MIKAVCYYRSKGESIVTQKNQCREFAKRQGYTIVAEYADCGFSGITMDRPEFQAMIADSRNNGFQYVIVFNTGRLARDTKDFIEYKQKLQENGVKVISVSEDMPDGIDELYNAVYRECNRKGL